MSCGSVIDVVLLLTGDYEGALARLTEMTYLLQEHVSLLSSATSQHVGVFADVLTSCELLRVFLLLLLQVTSSLSCSQGCSGMGTQVSHYFSGDASGSLLKSMEKDTS